MKDRMLRVNIIPVEDSFVHLSSKLIRELNALRHDKQTVYCSFVYIFLLETNLVNLCCIIGLS